MSSFKGRRTFLIFLLGMAVYYGWRMFSITPWYDELYTYYYFISRGPVYAAIHWPLPNNHVGYSVLSACLGIFGDSAIALRGVSYLCSLANLILLYLIGEKILGRKMALVPVFLFAGMNLTNQLAVQGRGYALVTCCYLTALYELIHITIEHREKKRDYLLFGISLVIALYAIPSSVYMVVPVCVIGGIILLLQREYRKLWKLILASVAAAFCTLCLYGVIWLAIGSNLLVKTEGSVYFGMGHAKVILEAPFAAMKTGIDYMLATPYIQSVERSGFFGQFRDWLQTLFGTHFSFLSMVGGKGILYGVIIAAGFVLSLRNILKRFHREDGFAGYDFFAEAYFTISLILLPLFLIVQCKLPYFRVFSFAGVLMAFLMAWLVLQAAPKKETLSNRIGVFVSIVSGAVCIFSLLFNSGSYSLRDDFLADAYRKTDVTEAGKIAVTDCDQEYLLLYLYGIDETQVTRQIEDADIVVLDKALLDMAYGYRDMPEEWKFYLAKEEVPKDYLEQEMSQVYENWHFVVYRR